MSDERVAWFEERTKAHIDKVKLNAQALVDAGAIGQELLDQVSTHDDSKLVPPERDTYIDITWMYRCKRENVPFEISSDLERRMAEATVHHIKNNRHHPEFWAQSALINHQERDAPPLDGPVDASTMDAVSLAEMVCDWVAVAQEKLNTSSAHEWADSNIGNRWEFTEEQQALIYEFLDALTE
jgi:hypothetical protein